ncbi:MAG: hypothetical protein ACFE9C_05305 [Candidatus Hodarchaeota archaeon]
MEGVKIRSHNEKYVELDYGNSDKKSKFLSLIKKEYIKQVYKIFTWLIILFLIYSIYYTLSSRFLIFEVRIFLNQIVAGIIIVAFLIMHFFQLTSSKFSPSLVNFLYSELQNLDFEIKKKYKMGLNFFLFNSFTIILFSLINIFVQSSPHYFISSLTIRFMLIFTFAGTLIPLIAGVFHDQFIVKLKSPYFIKIDLRFKFIKHLEAETHMIRILMTSSKLSLRSNKSGFGIYKEISDKRWLPKKSRLIIPKIQLTQYLHFQDNSSLINFKEHFLNIVSAMREWDIKNPKSYNQIK